MSDPNAGIFGPASLNWRISRESAIFLAAGRAALLQLAHPWVAASLAEHSSVMDRPIARFHNTFRVVFTMIFGTLPQALTAARHLYALHTQIQGKMPADAGRWKSGSQYRATEIGALRWVFATLVESAVLAHDCALPPLLPDEREHYYADSKILAGLFGIPAASLPENWDAFAGYNRRMHASDELGVSEAARRMAHNLLRGAGSWIKPPLWYRALTIEWLPERFRTEFELDFGAPQQRAAARARRRLPQIYRGLPASVRFVGPWHEAQARLAHRPIGPLTRWSNRFWIGRPLLPFA
ncbi:MAG TPA: oxygenase MpaB family protein [Terracidiphilus sp.]